jgi:Yip1 domain
MNNIGLLTTLATDPRKLFDELSQRPRVLFPLLLTIGVTLLLSIWYVSHVDIQWLIEQSIRANPRTANMTDEQLAPAMRFMSRNTFLGSAVVAGVLLPVLFRVLEAAYYLLAGKIVNVQQGFKQWWSLACWSSLPPLLVAIPGMLGLLLSSTTQIPQDVLNPLSLNALFIHKAMGAAGYSLFTSINVLHIASLGLAVIGVQHWSRRSWGFSTVFTLLPFALIYGIWAWIALGRS